MVRCSSFSFQFCGCRACARPRDCVCLLAVIVDKLSANRVFLSGDRGDIGALCRSPQLCLSNNFPPASSASPDRSLCTDTLSSWNTSLVVWSVVWTSASAHTQTHIVQLTPPHTHTQTHIVQLTPPPTHTHRHTLYNSPPLPHTHSHTLPTPPTLLTPHPPSEPVHLHPRCHQ